MKWANTTSNHAICQIDKNIYIFEKPLDNLVSEGAITAQTKADLTHLGGLPTSDSWESFNLQAPLANPSKIICLGLNYTDHAQEVGVQLPKNPTLFTKYSNALIGPYDTIHLPPQNPPKSTGKPSSASSSDSVLEGLPCKKHPRQSGDIP